MGKELYNNKSSIENISRILGEMPKIKTSDNFEFNLMTKIQNKNFDPIDKHFDQKSKFSWIFAPASVVAVTIVMMFFIFDFQKVEPENLLMSEPEKINEITAGFTSGKMENKKISESTASLGEDKKDADAKPESASKSMELNRSNNESAEPYAAKSKERTVLPFNNNDAIDLDNYISSGRNANSINSRGLTVGGAGAEPDFEGFMLQYDDAQLNILKAKIDSLFNAMKDSLNSNINN